MRCSPRSLLWVVLCFYPALAGFAFANAVQDENALPGTAAWQLTNQATVREIEGFASLTSVNKGSQIKFFVSSADPNFNIEIYRMGWYGGDGARQLLAPI